MAKKRTQASAVRANETSTSAAMVDPAASSSVGPRLSKEESKLARKQHRMRLRAAKKSSRSSAPLLVADASRSLKLADKAGNEQQPHEQEGAGNAMSAAVQVNTGTKNKKVTVMKKGTRPMKKKGSSRGSSAGGGNVGTQANLIKRQQLQKQKQRQRRQAAQGSNNSKQRTALHQSQAQQRLESAQDEMALFDHITQVPAFVQDPFAALLAHLDTAMPTLQPQTPDLGRATTLTATTEASKDE